MLRIIYVTICLTLLSYSISFCQKQTSKYPKVGDKLEDYTFSDLDNFNNKSFKISDFKGKWLVLDFWSRWCTGCIASFPKMNKIDKQLGERAKLVMVGLYVEGETKAKELALTKDIVNRRKDRYGLKFTVAYDGTAWTKYDVAGVPAIFVINPQGILVAKATALDSAQIETFLAGGIPIYDRSYSGNEPRQDNSYNPRLPLLTSGKVSNGGNDTSYVARSIFTKWNPSMITYKVSGFSNDTLPGINGTLPVGIAEAIGVNLSQLFRLAYTGEEGWDWSSNDSLYRTFSRKLILETKDSAMFYPDPKLVQSAKNKFAYSVSLPLTSLQPSKMRLALLQDLQRYLLLKSHLETREVNVFKVVVRDKNLVEKLRSKGGESSSHVDGYNYHFKNMPFREVIKGIGPAGLNAAYNFDYTNTPAIINDTGIDFDIDWDFSADLKDWEEVKELLPKFGLQMVEGTTKMNCIVIKDY